MTRTRVAYLHSAYVNSTISIEEWNEFKGILKDRASEDIFEEIFDREWDKISSKEIADLDARRFEKILEFIVAKKPAKIFRLFPRIAAVACLLLMFLGGLYYLQLIKQKPVQYTEDIHPGSNGATLILSSGKTVDLSNKENGLITGELGVVISKTSGGQIIYSSSGDTTTNKTNVLSTGKGQTFVLRLPDSSKVWLNAASTLTYSAYWNHKGSRKVKLKGEAYFEVYKDKHHPFIVESNGQQVQVLGTHFNINAYPNELATKTTLIEGAVKVMPISKKGGLTEQSIPILLLPGQQSELFGNSLKVSDADIQEVLGWTNGKFIFSDENIVSIMRKVSLWYDIEVSYQGDVSEINYWGSVSRNNNISSVLEYLSRTGNVRFSITGRKVTVIRQ